MADPQAIRRHSTGGSWQPRGRGRGYYRNGTNRQNGHQRILPADLLAVAELGESSQQIITELLEANQGPYSGWKLYNKQETEQRKRRSPNWGEAETLALLQLWGERVQEMKTTKRNGFMLDEMARLLQERGYSRSSTEVKTRIANLSQEYRMELRKRSLGFPKGNFKLWDAVHAILGSDESMMYSASDQAAAQQQQIFAENLQQLQQLQHLQQQAQLVAAQQAQHGGSGSDTEGAEALCCDIDPGMLMAQQECDEEEENENDHQQGTHQGELEKQPAPAIAAPAPSSLPPAMNLPTNGLPNIPPSLTISLTSVPPLQAPNGTHSSSRVPALIRMGTKRPSQEGTPPPPTSRKTVGKKPRFSLDSALLAHVRAEEAASRADHNSTHSEESNPTPESVGWAFVLEFLQQTKHENELHNRALMIMIEQQIKLQRQSIKMQKRILNLLEKQESPEGTETFEGTDTSEVCCKLEVDEAAEEEDVADS